MRFKGSGFVGIKLAKGQKAENVCFQTDGKYTVLSPGFSIRATALLNIR